MARVGVFFRMGTLAYWRQERGSRVDRGACVRTAGTSGTDDESVSVLQGILMGLGKLKSMRQHNIYKG